MRKYASLRHEAASLQAIRIAHFVVPTKDRMSWNGTISPRSTYWQGLMNEWPKLRHYCLISAEIEKFFLFNPTDLGRWVGGGPFAVPIDGCRRSHLLPAAFVLTACGGIEIDSYLRDYLSNAIAPDEFEAMSWMGFRRKDHDLYEHSDDEIPGKLESAFRRSGDKPTSRHVALVLFQCRVPQGLDKIETVFEHLKSLPVGRSPNRVSWRPAIVGLLKGNVDAFAVLERSPRVRSGDNGLGEFDELALHLESQQTGTRFWDGIRPVALYGGKKAEWVVENWELLDPLPPRNGSQQHLSGPVEVVDGPVAGLSATDPPQPDGPPSPAQPGNSLPAPPPLAR